MLEKATIARPYAQAVFELAQESKGTSEWSASLELLNSIVSDAQMRLLMNNPNVRHQHLQDHLLLYVL